MQTGKPDNWSGFNPSILFDSIISSQREIAETFELTIVPLHADRISDSKDRLTKNHLSLSAIISDPDLD